MENGSQAGVWQRVKPTLNPWPGADAVGKALEGGAKADGVVLASDAAARRDAQAVPDAARNSQALPDTARNSESVSNMTSLIPAETLEMEDVGSLPGAEPDPCCMGTEAVSDLAVVTGFLEDERSERRQLQALARQAPAWARQTVLTLAAHAAARARRLSAAHYLIIGETYLPAIAAEKIYVGKWRPALRERYHSAACAALNYERAADGTPDPCLGDLFGELAADAFESANVVMRLLERALI